MASEGDTKNLSDLEVIELDSLNVNEYHPKRDGKGKPTEVHLAVTPKGHPNTVLIIRMKSARIINEVIAALVKHRDVVWPAN